MRQASQKMSTIKIVVINLVVFIGLYGIIEISYSAFRYFFTDTSPDSYSLFEHPSETIRFDAVRGYFLTRTPSRVARVNHNKLEYAGFFHGNAQGFADRDDFSVKRLTRNELRVAVFGDSFTSATMEPLNAPNWPDRVEDLSSANDSGQRLVLLNFAVDGGGLANWVSIVRNVVVAENYDLDGLVFAVAWDDLDRKFAMFDQIDSKRFMHARATSWDVDAQPKTRREALLLLEKDVNPANRRVLSSEEFDAFLAGRWKPREWHFRIAARFASIFKKAIDAKKPSEEFEPGQIALINEIHKFANQNSWPIAVAYVPNREELLDPKAQSNVEKCRKFAELLGARFLDGREAFRGLSSQQIKDDWFPIDGHWNRGGSDQFAFFIADRIQRWIGRMPPQVVGDSGTKR